jgi:glycosyltransferase involved in cell wall biosynthesis
MKVFTHNFNPQSNSGPNKFTRSLFAELTNKKGFSINSQDEADVEFCLIQQAVQKKKPMVLRLDGIYFNSEQDYERQNAPIKFAYENADAVIFQSEFNKKLTEKWFGSHINSNVIHNAYFGEIIKDQTFRRQLGDREIWSCASSWRPHKRLVDNVRYYLENSPENSIFLIAGSGYTEEDIKNIQKLIKDNFYKMESRGILTLGELDYNLLRQMYDASSTFVHLAYLDHCPNVVVDAEFYKCKIICSDSGGTKEIISKGTIIKEKEWDLNPTKLYLPPSLDFNNRYIVDSIKKESNICLDKYEEIFRRLI